MRRYFSAFLILLSTLAYAQVNVGNLQRPDSRSEGGELRRNDVRSMQRTKLVFFYGEKDMEYLADYKKAMSEVWSLTKVEFDSIENLDSYERPRNISFLKLELDPVIEVNTNLGTETTVGYKAYYHLFIPDNRRPETFARIDLFLNYEDEKELLKIEKEADRMNWLYKNGKAYNWNPGFMKVYFKQINDILKSESNIGLYDNLEEQDSVSMLMNSTLYAPDYILAEQDFRSGEISYRPALELFDDYPFDYKVLKTAELGEKILKEQNPFSFLLYTLSGDEKHVSVYTSDGKLLYHRFSGNAYNLDDKDLKKLAKTID